MAASGSIDRRVIQNRARVAQVEALIGFVTAGWRVLSRRLEAIAEDRRRALACRDLHGLSDHYLKDIGIERSQIDRMFR